MNPDAETSALLDSITSEISEIGTLVQKANQQNEALHLKILEDLHTVSESFQHQATAISSINEQVDNLNKDVDSALSTMEEALEALS